MKTAIIMRHAKSSWADANAADHERPLNKRGRRSAPVMAQRIITKNDQPDVLLSSSSQRTVETASYLIQEGVIDRGQCFFSDQLYLASASSILNELCERTEDKVMILAHNPGVTYFVNHFSDARLDNLPTAGVAVIAFDVKDWSELRENKTGKLQWLEFPRMFE